MRKLTALSSGALAVAMVTTLPAPLLAAAGAAPAEKAPAQSGLSSDTKAAAPKGSYDITLVTGDRVHLTVQADGRQAATVAPAPRENGRTPNFKTQVLDGHAYVIPDDVATYIPTRLDPTLFDVTSLVAQGYDDKKASSIPVIVDYYQGKTPGGRGLPAVKTTRNLPSIGADAATVAKATAPALGAALSTQASKDYTASLKPGARANTTAATGVFAGIDKIWLDAKVTVKDEVSAPQIGAPEAWAAGFTGSGVKVAVLDTGVDTTHPDLASKVVESENFSDSNSTIDRFGHGSHVAGIIAGTGEASGGLRKGIAPDASILNAKVLNDAGSGPFSQIIAGAEWAAQHGAKIANLSLGAQGFHSDGTDPLSQAINELTDQYGTLFVIAAGNDGGTKETVTSPGTADRALTVGAVDRNEAIAGFSSKGPRAGDFAIKPDITAPGVDIIAPRAAGSNIGPIVDGNYMSLSGTSMATPHVAGAAAVLLQERPDLTADQLKAALASTAESGDHTVYQQGAGRVDLSRAVKQDVYSATTSLSMGYFPFPQDNNAPVTKTITYRNVSASDVTLDLAMDVKGDNGAAPADGMVSLSANSVTVPANGTADVSVTVDSRLGDFALYGGAVTATGANGVSLRTPVGFYKEAIRHNLTVKGFQRDGRPAGGISAVDVMNVDDRNEFFSSGNGFVDGEATFRVPPGTYSVQSYLFTYDEPGVFALDMSAVHAPQVDVNEDTEVTLDARTAKPMTVQTPDPTAPLTVTLDYYREDTQGKSFESSFTISPPIDRAYAAETAPITKGRFEFHSEWALEAPVFNIGVNAAAPINLHPLQAPGSPLLDGKLSLPLVYAGLGKPEELAAADVKGKVALIKRGELTFAEKALNATAAGAKMVLVYNNVPGLLFVGGRPDAVPTYSLSQAEGEALQALLTQGTVTINATGTPVSPYRYDLVYPESGTVPANVTYPVNNKNTAKVTHSYHADGGARPEGVVRHNYQPYQSFLFGFLWPIDAPRTRTEYVSANSTTYRETVYSLSTPETPFVAPMFDEDRMYKPGAQLTVHSLQQPMRPGALPTSVDQTAVRSGDTFTLNVPEFADAANHWGFGTDGIDTTAFRMFRDGQQIASGPRAAGSFGVPADAGQYRLELDVARNAPWATMSTNTSTAWTFNSARSSDGADQILPMMTVDYNVGLDLTNRATGKGDVFTLQVGHIPGAANPSISGATVQVSYDGGKTWKAAKKVKNEGRGAFEVSLDKKDFAGSDGYVSLKVEAWDSQKNRIEQTINHAYALPAR